MVMLPLLLLSPAVTFGFSGSTEKPESPVAHYKTRRNLTLGNMDKADK